MNRLLCLLAVAFVGACGPDPVNPNSQTGGNPRLPKPHQYLLPPMHLAKNVGWGNAVPHVAPGLKVGAFARNLRNPRFVYVLPNGDVLVVESQGPIGPVNRPKEIVMRWMEKRVHSKVVAGNRIILLRDINGDGLPDIQTVFLDHVNSPFGIALIGNEFYVANTDSLMRYAYTDGETKITDTGTILTALPGGPINHHWTKSLAASPAGDKLYVGVGSNSNVAENGFEAEKDRASIWEIDPATGAHRLFATGLRNPTGLTFEPVSRSLWTIVNERDELGPDLVPDYMTAVKDGGFYGWPYSYFGQHIDPRVMPQRADLVVKAIAPDYALSSHVAPLGIVFDFGGQLSATLHGGAFISEHGSWDRSEFNGYKVIFVPFRNGKPSGPPRDVLTGFIDGDNAHGRPVGLAIDKRGGLLVADDVGGAIWRVTSVRN